MGDVAQDAEQASTRRQALVTLDKVGEAIEDGNFEEASEAVLRLGQRVDELMEGADE